MFGAKIVGLVSEKAATYFLINKYKINVSTFKSMGFADFARDSAKKNRELRIRKEPFQRMKENYFITPQPATFKSASPHKVKEITRRYLKLKKREKIIGVLLFMMSALLVGWLFFSILFSQPTI